MAGTAGKGTKRLTHLGFSCRGLGASKLVGLLVSPVEGKIAVVEMLDGIHAAVSGQGLGSLKPKLIPGEVLDALISVEISKCFLMLSA